MAHWLLLVSQYDTILFTEAHPLFRFPCYSFVMELGTGLYIILVNSQTSPVRLAL